LGNLQDISQRAIEVLKQVDLVAAEDTRRSRQLLSHFGISTQMESYHDDSGTAKPQRIVEQLMAGKRVALLSDSGTPAVSDPGAELVRQVLNRGMKVVPIPGPSAVTAAFSVAGISASGFLFAGYPPRKASEKRQFLEEIAAHSRPVVLYEAPHRVADTLQLLAEICPQRQIGLARELTKLHEEIRYGPVGEIAQAISGEEPRGEFTLVLNPAPQPPPSRQVSEEDIQEAVEAMLEAGLSHRDAAHIVELLTGLSRNEAYQSVQRLGTPESDLPGTTEAGD
ncbi:MAG: 16S rRNA (cytidine(1402)-2'-O)-methyltransferase, partial [Armatimonadetes bacterium]|nr:16S rRNA (cytidine(1402)-2'-O)-methyltransferase [Armatimonadota bacterium]